MYTVPEAGKILDLGRSSAFAAAARGDIPTIRIGGRVLVPKKALEPLLESAGRSWPDGESSAHT